MAQIKAARALLGWGQEDLARASGLSVQTIKRLETERGLLAAGEETIDKIEEAFDRAGLELISPISRSMSGGMGIRMKFSDHHAALVDLEHRLGVVMNQIGMLVEQDADTSRKDRYVAAAKHIEEAWNAVAEEIQVLKSE